MSNDTKAHAPHIVSLKIHLGVGAALFILTGITVAVSFVQLGGWNLVVALGVASIKASLVALIYMHLRYDKKIYMIVFLTAILFLAIFIIFTMFDTMTRDQLYSIKAEPINKNAALYDSLDETLDHGAVGDTLSSDSAGAETDNDAETHGGE